MKVLFVDLEREWRGGQSQAFLTLRGLRDVGYDVTLLAARNSPLSKRVAHMGVSVHEVARIGLRAWAAKAMSELIANHRFQLIHLNEPHSLTAAWMAHAHRHLPLLLSRRIGFPLQKNRVSRARYRSVERFLANSKDVARSLMESGIAADRISIVNEGVEIPPLVTPEQRRKARARWGFGKNDFVFGCASVFVPEKGQRHLIEALTQLRKTHPDARLLLAGDGPLRFELQVLASRLGQTATILFPGFVENIAHVYAALDAFVFPSEFEGLGTALQAAMAMAIPCVSTARGALEEVVDQERTALVVEPNGKEFHDAMLRLMTDQDLRQRIALNGKQEVEQRFSASQMVQNTVRVYEDVLRRRHAA
ncbi:MAG TPA: glycosyltransferase family 4 protein [Candidatus Dormibacteraeota bacterium]|nr:glycosyltransferase family 4 protein [Candidatus Dormibacteraeota bacterium]